MRDRLVLPDGTPAAALGGLLRERGETISVAESCTGGLLCSLITDVPGASDYFVGGIVSYTEDTKLHELAVTRELLETHGAVSEPVAREMAQHVRDEADTTWSLSTTGVAGPTGGTDEEPVGSVYIGIAHAGEADDPSFATVEHHQFEGSRHAIKRDVADRALRAAAREIGERD